MSSHREVQSHPDYPHDDGEDSLDEGIQDAGAAGTGGEEDVEQVEAR